MSAIESVCVFCGASRNVPQAHLDSAAQFGAALAKRQQRIVYGGGDCGMMGAVADAALSAGGEVVGVFPQGLNTLEIAHKGLSEIIITDTMHERKRIMFERSDAIVILPGGVGTMDEMFEIITWKQLRFHQKPIIIFNHLGYWDKLIALIDNMISEGFSSRETRALFVVATSLEEVLAALS